MKKSSHFSVVLLLVLMFLSGFAGISYEVLYGRLLGDLLGDQFAVSASVLMTFLLGIGWGARGAHRLWKHLWLVEAGIGLYALLFLACLPWLDQALYSGAALLPGGLAGSILVGVVLLLFPSFLIGCSLPLFAGYLEALSPRQAFARAYALYNLGAAGTALGIEFFLIRWWGIFRSVLFMAGVNLLVSIVLRSKFVEILEAGGASEMEEGALQEKKGAASRDLASLALLSFGSAVFQLTMIKIAELVLGPFRENFALVLTLVLLGVAGGSWAVRRWRWSFSHILAGNVLGLLGLAFGLWGAIHLYASSYATWAGSYSGGILLKWCFLALLMGLPSLTYGAAIPALLQEGGRVTRDSGHLLFVSSLANAGGFLVMALVLHPRLDFGPLLLVILAITALSWLFHGGLSPRAGGLAVVAMVLVLGVHRLAWDEDLLYLSYTKFRSPEALAQARREFSFSERYKGFQDIFSIVWHQGRPRFFINGYVSIPLDSPAEKIVGAISSLFAPRRDRSLVLGLGSGATASTVGLLFQETDVVEINQVVRDNLYRMREWNYDIEANPRVRIHVDDGVHFVKSPGEPYSLILNTVTTPLYFSSSKLYTRDFLEQVKSRLTSDGIYVTWIDSRVGDEGGAIILRTLARSFSHCVLVYVKAEYFLLIASDRPLKAASGSLLAENAALQADLGDRHGLRLQDLAYCLLVPDAYGLLDTRQGPVNSLDRPILEFRMARLRAREFAAFLSRLEDSMNLQELARALDSSLRFNPYRLLFLAEDFLGDCHLTQVWRQQVRDQDPDFSSHLKVARDAYLQSFPTLKSAAVAYGRYAHRLLQAGQFALAERNFREVLRLNPERPHLHLGLGECCEGQGKYRKALEEYALERAHAPEDGGLIFRTARVLFKLQHFSEARDLFLQARKMSAPPENDFFLGMTESLLGNRSKALQALRRAHQKLPDNPDVARALAEVERRKEHH
jgi:tetratricopeptide (TPR) repeat protein/predicted membrane-bound spermidine synthase